VTTRGEVSVRGIGLWKASRERRPMASSLILVGAGERYCEVGTISRMISITNVSARSMVCLNGGKSRFELQKGRAMNDMA